MSEEFEIKIASYVWGKQIPTECSEFAEFILEMMKDLNIELKEGISCRNCKGKPYHRAYCPCRGCKRNDTFDFSHTDYDGWKSL